MKRSAFPPSPFPVEFEEQPTHPAGPLLSFILLSLAIGLARTPTTLVLAAAGVLCVHLIPRPAFASLKALLLFLPVLLLTLLIYLFPWRGLLPGGQWRWPFHYDAGAWTPGLTVGARMGLWILLSARSVDRLHPAALLARLPRRPGLARLCLAPALALSWLALMIREAWLLERAGWARGGRRRLAHWPSVLLPLFRNLLARSETLSEALLLRRFPARWAGRPAPRPGWREIPPVVFSLAVLVCILLMRED